jgi:predicted  nucleic acid-binding Zn-ribbon protein
MAVTKDDLDTAKEKLAKASDFKVLRTSSEKSEELKKIKKEIEDFEKELEDLEAEQNRLNLELDKIN